MKDGFFILWDSVNHRCWIGHNSLRARCNRRRNKNCMLKSRHRRFTRNRAEYFTSSEGHEPRRRSWRRRKCWRLGTYRPVRDSRAPCFGLSSDKRKRWWWLILCSSQRSHQFRQFMHPSLHGRHLVYLSLHGCHLFFKCLILLFNKIHLLLYICPSTVYASWFWMRTSGHFWNGRDLLWKRKTCETRIWNYEMQDDAWCYAKIDTFFIYRRDRLQQKVKK